MSYYILLITNVIKIYDKMLQHKLIKSVYCAVRTWSLNKAVCAYSVKG